MGIKIRFISLDAMTVSQVIQRDLATTGKLWQALERFGEQGDIKTHAVHLSVFKSSLSEWPLMIEKSLPRIEKADGSGDYVFYYHNAETGRTNQMEIYGTAALCGLELLAGKPLLYEGSNFIADWSQEYPKQFTRDVFADDVGFTDSEWSYVDGALGEIFRQQQTGIEIWNFEMGEVC